mgnify:CR=1 FL=1
MELRSGEPMSVVNETRMDDTAMPLDATRPARLSADFGCAALPPDDMVQKATEAANFLKALSHEGRLMILCHLSTGEKSVTELENLLASRQAAVSQQLARLRLEGLVTCRREGKVIYYSLGDPRVLRTIALVYDLFCGAD